MRVLFTGIDPSGRIPHGHFDESDDESDDNESCGSALQSPRYGAAFGDCNISPADGGRTFGDFSTPPHLRLLRTKHPVRPLLALSLSLSLFFHIYSD